MLKVGLAGMGYIGRIHLKSFLQLESHGLPVKVQAICDSNKEKFILDTIKGNIDNGDFSFDLDKYTLYSDFDEMLDKEHLDLIDITLPTFLHSAMCIKALDRGINVICEKPMALNSADCKKMMEAADRNGKKLMIAQCLRFWPEYEFLKECVDSGRYGRCYSGYFFRGGNTPGWSDWLLKKEKSGGAILDQHLHDTDMINWLFGKPESVSTIAGNTIPGSRFDVSSTNYHYSDGKVINAQNDWTLQGDYGFEVTFRVNFEKANLVYKEGTLKVNPNDGRCFIPELPKETGYYREIRYFVQTTMNNAPVTVVSPVSAMESIEIIEAEVFSASNNGKVVFLK